MKNLNLKVVFVLSSFILLFSTSEKTQAGDLQRRREAVRLFCNKQYARALPLFAQLVSNHPENYKYNYYYGACLLIADKDKMKAVEHLEMSLKNPKSPEDVYYYLARAYHLSYMFDEGIRAISEFNKLAREKQRAKFKTGDVASSIYSAKNHLDSTRNQMVKEYIPATQEDFFSKYAFEGNFGKILSMPDEYQTKKSEDENPTIFLSADGTIMFYSAFNQMSGSRDIYKAVKATDGSWGKPEILDMAVNTDKDELFPTCSPDGHVLYFSSMGHSTTGGFDIYKSVYIRAENKWTKAENMGSPYNSPFDDYNFVPSGTDKIAYFTSNRNCNWGQLMVCKLDYISGEQIPIELQGRLSCINNPDIKEAKLTVTRVDNGSVVASLTTDPVTGSYNILLPCAGAYSFQVEAKGFQSHSQIATFSEFGDTYFIQKIYLSKDQQGIEDLAINTLRASDAAKLEENLMAAEDENGSTGLSASDITNTAAAMSTAVALADAGAITDAGATNTTTTTTTMADTDEAMDAATTAMTGVEYRVQIAAFKRQSVEESRRKLSKKTKDPMMTDNYDKKWNRFYIGREDNYKKAKDLKTVLRMAGFKDAFVVAFKEDQPVKIPMAIIKNSK